MVEATPADDAAAAAPSVEEAFLQWLDDHGADRSKLDWPVYDERNNRCARAKCDVGNDDFCLRVPEALMMTPTKAEASEIGEAVTRHGLRARRADARVAAPPRRRRGAAYASRIERFADQTFRGSSVASRRAFVRGESARLRPRRGGAPASAARRRACVRGESTRLRPSRTSVRRRGDVLLATFIVSEMRKGEDSFWAPYLATLGPPETVCDWDASDLAELSDPDLSERSESRDRWVKDLHDRYHVKELCPRYPELFPADWFSYVRRAEISLMNRGDAAAATWTSRGEELWRRRG